MSGLEQVTSAERVPSFLLEYWAVSSSQARLSQERGRLLEARQHRWAAQLELRGSGAGREAPTYSYTCGMCESCAWKTCLACCMRLYQRVPSWGPFKSDAGLSWLDSSLNCTNLCVLLLPPVPWSHFPLPLHLCPLGSEIVPPLVLFLRVELTRSPLR